MKNRSGVAAMVIAASMMTTGVLCVAPAFAAPKPFSAVFSREKLVSFNVKNATAQSIIVKAGEREITLAPGQTAPMKLAAGVKLVAVNTTANHEAGSVLVEVGSQLDDSTVVLN